MGLRLYGLPTGENLGAVQLSIGAESASIAVAANQQPATVTGLPRINSGQADGDTLTIDAGGLTLTGYQWQELDGTWANISGATSATYDTTGNGHAGKWLRCVTPEGTTPAVHIYMQMAMASHNADDVAMLALFPHDDATHIAVASGNWGTPSTWLNNRVPGYGARVLIPQGITGVYDHDGFERLDWVRIDGTLNWALDQDTKILCETIFVSRGGQMNCGTPGNRLPVQYTAEFAVANRYYRTNAYGSTNLGGGTLANDPTLVSRGILSHGSRVMWGAAKEHWLRTRCTFELATTLNGATETTVVLAETIPTTLAASGVFQVIDDDGEYIDLTYTSYSGSTLTISSADFSTVNATAGNVAYISFAPKAGDTKLTLAKAATGWQIGDQLVVGGTLATLSLTLSESEVVTITAVNGDVVDFTPTLEHTHDHKNPAVTRADLQPGIGNLTRNIKIYTEGGPNNVPHKRGHTMDIHMHCHQDLWEVEHFDLGRTIKNPESSDGPLSGKIDPLDATQLKVPAEAVSTFTYETLTTASNLQSRYPMHGHLVGRHKAQQDTINGCTVRNTPGWGIVHHGGNQLVNENVVYEFKGTGIAAEQGDETGEWINNFAAKSLNRVYNNAKILQSGSGGNGDDMRWGYAFAFRDRAIRSTGNLAMDCSHGHVYMHRQNVSITPSIELQRDGLDFGDLGGVEAGEPSMISGTYPIIHNNFCESAGIIHSGLYVSKAAPGQGHGLGINIKDFKGWSVGHEGLNVEYIGQYIVSNADCVGSATAAADPNSVGVRMSTNTHQVATVNARVEGWGRGVAASGTIIQQPIYAPYDPATDPLHSIVNLKAINCITDTEVPVDTLIKVGPSTPVEPSHNLPFKIGYHDGTAVIKQTVTGTLVDTLTNAGALPKPIDYAGIPVFGDYFDVVGATNNVGSFIQGWMTLVGGYDVVDGVDYAVFPLYFTDRETGVPIRTLHGIELQSAGAQPLRRTWSRAANTITINSGNPVQFNVASGGSQTIDIMALVSDTAGASFSIAANPNNTSQFTHWNPDHGRLEWDGANSVTYTPDPGYTGPDIGWMWVEDDIGNCKRVDLEMTVT